MPRSHLPAAMSRAVSRSPPEGRCARLAFRPAQPFLRLGLAELGDDMGEQRVVVHVLAGADADLALPLRVGKLLVGDRAPASRAPWRRRSRARAAATRTSGRRRPRYCGGITLSSAADLIGWVTPASNRVLQTADVDGDQHVGRALGAFGLDALVEALRRRDQIDLDAGVLGEGLQQRLDQLGLAIAVEVDLALRERRPGGKCGCASASGMRCSDGLNIGVSLLVERALRRTFAASGSPRA